MQLRQKLIKKKRLLENPFVWNLMNHKINYGNVTVFQYYVSNI